MKGLITLFLFVAVVDQVASQHPVEIQRKAAAGDYMAALSTYKKMAVRKVTAASALAAGRSAWALGLPQVAKQELDRAANIGQVSGELNPQELGRIYFSRAIIEFQEENYQAAIVYAEKAYKSVQEKGPLLSEINQLTGESLIKLNKLLPAQDKLIEALEHVSPESEGDLRYLLASCQMQMGRLEQAKENFELVPLRHARGSLAIRGLASIAFETEKFDEAVFWLLKGREEFPESFLDSWIDYALVKSYGELKNDKELKSTYEQALKKFPPSDPWLILLQAVAEEFLWRPELRKNKNL